MKSSKPRVNRLVCFSYVFCYYIQSLTILWFHLLHFNILTVTGLILLSSNINKRVLDVLMTSVEGYYKSLRNCNSLPLMVLKIVLFYVSTTVISLFSPVPYEKLSGDDILYI